ncbi:MAG: hypothetical protein GAK35_02846 [Herbaspirillum frisingense]|uniref:Uncharacterized protein n=1 Tax=Herbaspirillum frisingense TaxID=92645 RepID=A0A7V8JTF6_9BURK|nr:MAG: hypothetical protein GAK35_02846 [Herbaspirillum frisingense]
MGRCKDCRFWMHGGECEEVNGGNDWPTVREDCLDVEVDAADDTGLSYILKTGPEFGCVRFQLRTA